jgi:sugar transferase (PEP-CTERM/EpsH1 system associated)
MHAGPNLLSESATGPAAARGLPLIAHVVFRLDVGGLENGVVNLVNRMPPERYRHAIVCLAGYSDFHRRIERREVSLYNIDKPPGNSPVMHWKLWRLFGRLRPDIVHTRNLATLEAALPAALAGVPARVHGEHGRDMDDLDGSSTSRQRVRRLFKPFVNRYITVSRDLATYLERKVDVAPRRITQIYNGVDTDRFYPAAGGRAPLEWPGAAGDGLFVIGTVGRMQQVKDQLTLARAFVELFRNTPGAERRLRLVMVGDGPLRDAAAAVLEEAGLARYAWLPGNRNDVPAVMRGLDLFVLPSLAEGISNTILEAMASGLPVVATAVGGNLELIDEGVTGMLVAPDSPAAMASALALYAGDADRCRRHGAGALAAIERRFRMDVMVSSYSRVYDDLLAAAGAARADRRHA